MRSLPHGSAPPSATTPVSSIGRVMPLIVMSPVSRTWLPSTGSPAVERNVISGWFSASKNSGDARWPSRFG
jgi:hypothetical protein